MKTTFFDQFTPQQLLTGYRNNLKGLQTCFNRSLKTGKYNGKDSAFWLKAINRYQDIIKKLENSLL